MTEPPQPELFLLSSLLPSCEELIVSLLAGTLVISSELEIGNSLEEDGSIDVVEGIILEDDDSSKEELEDELCSMLELLGVDEVDDGGRDDEELDGGSTGSLPLIVAIISFTNVLPDAVPTVIVVALTGLANVFIKSTPTLSLCDVIV